MKVVGVGIILLGWFALNMLALHLPSWAYALVFIGTTLGAFIGAVGLLTSDGP